MVKSPFTGAFLYIYYIFHLKYYLNEKKGLMLMILQSTLNRVRGLVKRFFQFLKIKIEKDLF